MRQHVGPEPVDENGSAEPPRDDADDICEPGNDEALI
jgi:hypothetical protein